MSHDGTTRSGDTRRLPAEWARQSAILLAWPAPDGDFQRWYTEVERTYATIAAAITKVQSLLVACHSAAHRESIVERLRHAGVDLARVVFIELGYDDIWVRDTAPLTIETSSGAALLNFRFNGWGGKYDCRRDARFGEELIGQGIFGEIPSEPIDFVLEGGSIDSDGMGTLLTTRYCLLNPNRNPGHSEGEIAAVLERHLGARRILWLGHGRAEGDDTDAHVDTLARFCGPDVIAHTSCTDPADAQYDDLRTMEAELRTFRTDRGEPYRLVPLPIPKAILDEDGERLPATYANFLIINDAVLLPVYEDPADRIATDRLATCFPERQIVPIDCRALIRQYGSLHCMTMQFPDSVPIRTP